MTALQAVNDLIFLNIIQYEWTFAQDSKYHAGDCHGRKPPWSVTGRAKHACEPHNSQLQMPAFAAFTVTSVD